MARASSPASLLVLYAVIGLAAASLPVPPAAAASPFPSRIEVFTTAAYPVAATPAMAPGATIQVYRLDAPDEIAAELGRDLPADPALALQVARQRFEGARPLLATRTRDAVAGLQRAAQLGVQRYPAVVFDGRQIVYGVTDVTTALAVYREHHQEQR